MRVFSVVVVAVFVVASVVVAVGVVTNQLPCFKLHPRISFRKGRCHTGKGPRRLPIVQGTHIVH